MNKGNVALRLQRSLLEEPHRFAETEGASLNEFVNVAVAEKLSALRTEEYFQERAQRGNIADAKRMLRKARRGRQPDPGDEL